VIGADQQLFQIEKSFRMAKSDLQARPICHRKRDSIEAHLTIVLAAVAVSRWIEHATGWSIRKFAKTARRYRTIQSAAVMVWSPAWTHPHIHSRASRHNDLETAVQLIAEELIGDAGLWFSLAVKQGLGRHLSLRFLNDRNGRTLVAHNACGPRSQPPVSGPKGQVRMSAAHLNPNYQGARAGGPSR
jgi:hypothetical protein